MKNLDKLTKAILKRAVSKLCEQNEQACPLINSIANDKYESEEKMWDDVRQYMCPKQDDNACSTKFENLKKQVLKDDEIIQKK